MNVLGVELNVQVRVHVETAGDRPACRECGATARVKDRPVVELADLSCFGRPTRLVRHKRRWRCVNAACGVGSWTEDVPGIAAARLKLTDHAGRWVTGQVGRWRRQVWSTSIEDAGTGQLLDVIEGRSAVTACEWLAGGPQVWLDKIRWAALDLSGPWRLAFGGSSDFRLFGFQWGVGTRHFGVMLKGATGDLPRTIGATFAKSTGSSITVVLSGSPDDAVVASNGLVVCNDACRDI